MIQLDGTIGAFTKRWNELYLGEPVPGSEDPNQLARTGNIRCTRDLATTVQHWGTGREANERASERASKRAEFERNTFHWATSLNNSHSRWLRFPRSVQFLFRPAAILPDFFHPLLFVHRLSIESACVSLSFSLLSARKTTVVVWKKPAPRRRRRRRRNLSFYRLRTRHRTIILRILSTLCIYIYIRLLIFSKGASIYIRIISFPFNFYSPLICI